MEAKEMNEIIDQLAYYHGMYCDGTPDSWDSNAINNFAIAIINECIITAESVRPGHVRTTFDDAMSKGTIQCVVEAIKNKFGL